MPVSRVACVVIVGCAALTIACGGDSARSHPTSASPVATLAADPAPPAGNQAATDRPASGPVAGEGWGPTDVTFPPRNEPLLFRTALEAKYRDSLRRSAVQTFVDQEGTVVWTQEYLRYRVNLCGHADAVSRVFAQIDGRGIQPVCGTTSTTVFPPRNEPLDFMVQLESKYRDGLRRSAVSSFVDVEGNVIWTQEYLRYRVSNCSHTDAQQKVFDQIDGRGVPGDCANSTFTGTWRGTVRSSACTASGFLAGFCGSNPSIVDTMTLTLQQNGTSVTGTINVGGFPAAATGTATGTRLSISGRHVSGGITTSYESWDTSLSGSTMVGTFVIGLSSSPLPGFARYTMSLSSVSKVARVSPAEMTSIGGGLGILIDRARFGVPRN
ncbi:MAG TPA: hypothetical protein VEC39_15445 [Vicinamibacterales bacterium]|nr:hypothetical protein [Vicinamibacterales bacterium]